MREDLKLFMGDNLIKVSVVLSLILIATQGIITLVSFSRFPPLIPLLNSRPWGLERLVDSSSVFIILPIFLMVFLINNFLSAFFYKNNTLIARILSFNTLLFIFLGVLAYIQIIFLVF